MSEFLVPIKDIKAQKKGCILHVYKDKRGPQYNKEDYALLRVPSVLLEEGRKYEHPVLGENNEVIFRREYYVDLEQLLINCHPIVIPDKEQFLKAVKRYELPPKLPWWKKILWWRNKNDEY